MPTLPHPAAAAVLTCTLVAAGTWCNRHCIGWLPDDLPRAGRKQHERPTPLAGILLLPAAVPWSWAAGALWLLLGVAIAAAVGFADDRLKERSRDLDWRWKAAGLGLAATAGACELGLPHEQPWLWLGVVGFVFVLTNATNFLDNTDGVAVALAATSLLLLGGSSGAAAAFGFAALGFLPWNWPRPRVFLGDSGAYALGLATGVCAARGALQQPQLLLAVGVQLVDFLQVVGARLWLGLPPWVGDRRHLTHVVQNLGLPRPATAPVFAAVALLLGLAGRR
jgi:UDP-N-acetylmuramyl pentapeptide phosphotransferase/UDP-N-acetylglucosamine-1-phosphate transferase